MILNACVKNDTMIDESTCKICSENGCSHAGELTTKERLDEYHAGHEAVANG